MNDTKFGVTMLFVGVVVYTFILYGLEHITSLLSSLFPAPVGY